MLGQVKKNNSKMLTSALYLGISILIPVSQFKTSNNNFFAITQFTLYLKLKTSLKPVSINLLYNINLYISKC